MARTKKENGSSSASTALRGIKADRGPEHADTFRRYLPPDRRADRAHGENSRTLATIHS